MGLYTPGTQLEQQIQLAMTLREHSSTIYQRVVKAYQMVAFIFQVDILKANYKANAMVYIDFLLIFHYFSSTVHTIITKWSNLSEVLRSMCLEGLNIQVK